ncbi:peptidoglycan binding domain-containing protein [Clostridium sp. OS1-26]|uniref:L,D-transpeptidase family protein n=1 Tax=Clostridium sp. OS1-26 TaxID=3070681 RepID=UPI0027E05D50|nr:peptidoglycan binding domain-containing protein [Clostridium sp. OS1-26]WML32561.1 peptidoglycan binding domain-containing protein [Clostridium sp. OS1-26]
MDITEKEKNKRSKVIIGIIISICAVLIVYFSMAAYFMNHFYFGSEINCVNVSGKTVEEVKAQMAAELQDYTLNLKERGGKSEQIRGNDIGIKYNSGGEYKNFKDRQNPFNWVSAAFNSKDSKMTDELSYDTKLLKERVDKLSCFQTNNIVEPKNPSFKYTDKGYIIAKEVSGNKVNKDILYDHVAKAILKEETTLELESINCYAKPKYTSESPKVIETKNILNKYISSKITYAFADRKETIDNSIINKWLKVNENLEITFDDKEMENYMNAFFDTYNTVGKRRNFVTSSRGTISIGSGDYGWLINADKEIKDLGESIKKGETITKEPTYIQKAVSRGNNDIGNTYVEIDMTNQHLWFYKNGSLIVQGDVVTGNVSSNHSTPKGIYSLKYKQRNTVLRGPGYNSPVDFWMPFNGGIGIHDASWRGEFGGNIYRTSGSHGCINSPYYLAKAIFNNIEEGTPVVCYY